MACGGFLFWRQAFVKVRGSDAVFAVSQNRRFFSPYRVLVLGLTVFQQPKLMGIVSISIQLLTI
jgi:hypothetical protein